MSGVAVAVGLGPTSASLGLFASAGAAAACDQTINRNAKRTPTGRAARLQVCQAPDRLRLCNPFAITPLIGVEENRSNLFAVAPTLQTMLPVRSFHTAPAEFQTARFPRISRRHAVGIKMPTHQFREGAFRAVFSVVVQQSIAVGGRAHLHSIEAAVPQKRTRNFSM